MKESRGDIGETLVTQLEIMKSLDLDTRGSLENKYSFTKLIQIIY